VAELFHPTNGWTGREADMTKLMVSFGDVANAPKNSFSNSDSIASDCRVIMQKISFRRYGEKRSLPDSKYSSRIFMNGLNEKPVN
jgi:hypothetical protein